MQANTDVKILQPNTEIYIIPNLSEQSINSPRNDHSYQKLSIGLIKEMTPLLNFRNIEEIMPRVLNGDARIFFDEIEAQNFMKKHPEDYHFLIKGMVLTSITINAETHIPHDPIKNFVIFDKNYFDLAMAMKSQLTGCNKYEEFKTIQKKWLSYIGSKAKQKDKSLKKIKSRTFTFFCAVKVLSKQHHFKVPKFVLASIVKNSDLFENVAVASKKNDKKCIIS